MHFEILKNKFMNNNNYFYLFYPLGTSFLNLKRPSTNYISIHLYNLFYLSYLSYYWVYFNTNAVSVKCLTTHLVNGPKVNYIII